MRSNLRSYRPDQVGRTFVRLLDKEARTLLGDDALGHFSAKFGADKGKYGSEGLVTWFFGFPVPGLVGNLDGRTSLRR